MEIFIKISKLAKIANFPKLLKWINFLKCLNCTNFQKLEIFKIFKICKNRQNGHSLNFQNLWIAWISKNCWNLSKLHKWPKSFKIAWNADFPKNSKKHKFSIIAEIALTRAYYSRSRIWKEFQSCLLKIISDKKLLIRVIASCLLLIRCFYPIPLVSL